MLIKVEPAGFFMYTVQMVFDVELPDSEDLAVRDYLAEYELQQYLLHIPIDQDLVYH